MSDGSWFDAAALMSYTASMNNINNNYYGPGQFPNEYNTNNFWEVTDICDPKELLEIFIQYHLDGSYEYRDDTFRAMVANSDTPLEIVEYLKEHPNKKVSREAKFYAKHRKYMANSYKERLERDGVVDLDNHLYYGDNVIDDYLWVTNQRESCFTENDLIPPPTPEKVSVEVPPPVIKMDPNVIAFFGILVVIALYILAEISLSNLPPVQG
jgi:hypothetical protein